MLRLADVEYDLAHGAIRLLKPQGCDKSALAYWAQNGEQYSVMEIAWATEAQPHGRGLVELHNGNTAKGEADIAASKSVDPRVAAEAADRGLLPKE